MGYKNTPASNVRSRAKSLTVKLIPVLFRVRICRISFAHIDFDSYSVYNSLLGYLCVRAIQQANTDGDRHFSNFIHKLATLLATTMYRQGDPPHFNTSHYGAKHFLQNEVCLD